VSKAKSGHVEGYGANTYQPNNSSINQDRVSIITNLNCFKTTNISPESQAPPKIKCQFFGIYSDLAAPGHYQGMLSCEVVRDNIHNHLVRLTQSYGEKNQG
jgi:hypothetical protein